MLDKWDWFKIFCTSSIYSVPVQKKLYQRKKLYYNIYTNDISAPYWTWGNFEAFLLMWPQCVIPLSKFYLKAVQFQFHIKKYPRALFKNSRPAQNFQIFSLTPLAVYTVQGCVLTAPGRLRRLTFSFGQLKKVPGRLAGHSCFWCSLQLSGQKNLTY